MRRLRVSSIQEGDCYEQAVFLAAGQKIVPARTPITAHHVQRLGRQGDAEVLLADSVDELAAEGVIEKLDGEPLGVGHNTAPDVIGAGGSVAVEAGQPVETPHVDATARGADAPAVQASERARLRKERMAVADGLIEQLRRRAARLDLRMRPREGEIWDTTATGDWPWPALEDLVAFRESQVETLRKLYGAVESGLEVNAQAFSEIVDALWPMLLDHRERFVQLALLVPRRDDYLPEHVICATVLAMATAAQLTWSQQDVKLTGLAALTCDVGMLVIPQRIRLGGEQLTDVDRGRVHRHTVYSVAMLESVADLPDVVRLAAWQHHERENGSGYPQTLRGEAICDLARVVAVGDVFAAVTSPRHYRRNRLPYEAMEQMVRSAAAGQFYKPATRALVQAAGLFPVGSYVKLSDERVAHVLAANPNRLDRPVVQPVDAEGQPDGAALDLARLPAGAVSVERPVAAPNANGHAA
ncbi:MAG: HD domain-containing protein [Alphaproteobacteria bacterium]|jgi:HD-GYP domain-containing protein (c-di-GMP phosphodiesterase class II)|nr:HD domain-containing protein [Alphaproteobacteria bacterium]